MNGAVARWPVMVFTSGVSCFALTTLSPVLSYAGPPMKVNAYSLASGATHAAFSTVVVKNTMSPATAGNAVTRSSEVIVVPLAVFWSSFSNVFAPVAPLSRTPSSR